MSHNPPVLKFAAFDVDPLEKWAQEIIRTLPASESANSSGKFFKTYRCWHFYKDSSHPLIRFFYNASQKFQNEFEDRYQRRLNLDFIILSFVEDSSKEICIWHKDGYFFNGQLHLTVLGNANIEIEVDSSVELLKMPNGSFWYLNGSSYRHRIRPSQGPRIEICAPVDQKPEDVRIKKQALSHGGLQLVDGNDPRWVQLRKGQAQYVLDSVRKRKASNLQVADFSIDPREV